MSTMRTRPIVKQDHDQRRRELVADLRALSTARGGWADASAAQTRPAILRQIAALTAECVPPGTDRLVAVDSDTALAAAIALHTGIPYAVLSTSPAATIGQLYPSEAVAVVGYEPSNAGRAVDALHDRQVRVNVTIAVVPGTGTADVTVLGATGGER